MIGLSQEFLDHIVSRPYAPVGRPVAKPTKGPETSFQDVLKQVEQGASSLRVSAHAATRMQQRGLQLSAADWDKVGAAVDKAQQKGARDAYVMYGDAGFVVNVPNKTVVTAMLSREEHVVTNIDSVITVPRLDR